MRVRLLRRLRVPLPYTPGVVAVAGPWMLWVITGPHAPQQAFWARAARLFNEQPPESAVKAVRG